MRIPRGTTVVAVAVAAIGAVAVAWPAAPAGAAPPPPAVRALTATGVELAFNRTRLTAPAGRVRLVFSNRSDLAHNVAIRGRNLARPRLGRVVDRGGVSRITVTVPPGRYTFFCSVFGHESGGMAGALVVPARRAR